MEEQQPSEADDRSSDHSSNRPPNDDRNDMEKKRFEPLEVDLWPFGANRGGGAGFNGGRH